MSCIFTVKEDVAVFITNFFTWMRMMTNGEQTIKIIRYEFHILFSQEPQMTYNESYFHV